MMNSRVQRQSGSEKKDPNGNSKNMSFLKGGTSDSATPETGDEGDGDRTSENEKCSAKQPSPQDAIGEGDTSQEKSEISSPQTASVEIRTDNDGISDQQEVGHEVPLKVPQEQQQQQQQQTQQAAGTGTASSLQHQPLTDHDQDDNRNWDDYDRAIGDDDEDENDGSDRGSEVTASDDDSDDDNVIWKARLTCGKLVNNEYVQVSIIILIIINAFMMGVGTFDFVTEEPTVDRVFEKIDKAFLVIFTIEVAMQLIYLGVALFADGWLVFDFFIVIFSWSFEQLQVVRAFRIFRAFRLITRVKPLRDLVLAIGAVLPRMYAIGALLMLVFYIYSVLFTELFKTLDLSSNYFKTLDASLFTCMEMMTLEWGGISREVMEVYWWAWAPMLTFILLTGFIVFNLIVAVVCDAVAVTEKTVRKLEGIESDNPADKLEQAQERIDLLQCHINDMLRTQQAVQDMMEVMAGEMLYLDAELRRSEQRESDLRIQVDRRKNYQKSMESTRQITVLEKRESRIRQSRSGSDLASSGGPQTPRTFRRRIGDQGSVASSRSSSRRNLLSDDGSRASMQSSRSASRRNLLADGESSEHKKHFRRSDSRRQLYAQAPRGSRESNRSLTSDL